MNLRLLLACFGMFLVLGSQSASAEEATWKAGSAFVRITPDKPMWMAGYAARTKPSEGVASELYAKALFLEDTEGHRAAIITFDLISVLKELRDGVAKAVETQYGIPASAVMLNCSHTHCGPVVRSTSKAIKDIDTEKTKQSFEYSQWLKRALIDLVGAAVENAEPSTITYHRSQAAFAMNRRLPTDSGFRNSANPDGPVDHDVPVLKVVNSKGELNTILFGYACHNTTLSFYEFCGDYAGFAQAEIERNHPGVVAMFVMGCGGDQNPYPRRTLELAVTHGKTLATAVEAALETPAILVKGPVIARLEHVKVTYAPPPSKEELESRLKTGNKYIAQHAQRLLTQLETEGKLRDSYSTLVQTFQFGHDLTLVALPGETVVDFSLRLKREFSDRHMWIAGYSNDVFAYVPSRRILQEGGYEGGGALVYFTAILHPGPFAEDIEERIIDSVHRQLKSK
ncbi:MAG: neutral/alkaline non-lysosomal ceramidase N-terminal domain-containing protein [Planctomycetaceae bacterium]|nr:neutral/alkaline non-lysosomal ceramidase N-terminal domain-containing protein [Planctomycetaceae bacterium]